MTIKYKPHEDFGFYHLPYIINLISEKVIFGMSIIQPQFAWNSSWLNFSSLLNLPLIGIKGTLLSNSVLYFFTLIFFFSEIKNNINKNSFSFYFILFLSFYTIIKFSRISAHGFDFPANYFLIFSFYYFIKIFECEKNDEIVKYFILLCIFSSLCITIKLTSFISPILVLFSFIYILKRKIHFSNFYKVFILCAFFILLWLIQQYIYTICLIQFYKFTCFTNVDWHSPNLSNAINSVVGSVNKSFNQYSGNLSESEYLKNLNWVPTWFLRNKIEMLEHFLALLIPVSLLLILNIKQYKGLHIKNIKFNIEQNFFYFLFISIFLGLVIWFNKSPVIRFGIPYLYTFIFIGLYFLINYVLKFQLRKGVITILILCCVFNVTKNIIRVKNLDQNSNFFPTILENKFSSKEVNGFTINYPDPEIVNSQSQLCWSIPYLCFIGGGNNIEIDLYKNYLFIKLIK